MRGFAFVIVILVPTLAVAQQYLPQPDLATCLARSHAQCRLIAAAKSPDGTPWNCRTVAEDGPPSINHPANQYPSQSNAPIALTALDGGTQWACETTTDGAASVQIRPGDDQFDAVHSYQKVGLNPTEQSNLKTRLQMGALLWDIIPGAIFRSRFTLAQITAITNAVKSDATLNTEYNAIKAAGAVDLQDPAVRDFIKRLLVLTILSPNDLTTVTAIQQSAN